MSKSIYLSIYLYLSICFLSFSSFCFWQTDILYVFHCYDSVNLCCVFPILSLNICAFHCWIQRSSRWIWRAMCQKCVQLCHGGWPAVEQCFIMADLGHLCGFGLWLIWLTIVVNIWLIYMVDICLVELRCGQLTLHYESQRQRQHHSGPASWRRPVEIRQQKTKCRQGCLLTVSANLPNLTTLVCGRQVWTVYRNTAKHRDPYSGVRPTARSKRDANESNEISTHLT